MIPLNPFEIAVKKYLTQTIPTKYTMEIDDVVHRVVHSLVTKKDVESFLRLMASVHEAGYEMAMDSMKESLAKQGFKVKISAPKVS